MPSPPCNLRIKRPTPTTVSFTVSTRAPLTTLTSHFIHYTALASRVIIAASILLVLSTKWCLWSTREGWNHLPTWLSQSLPGQGAKFVAENAMARYLVPVSMVVLWACARRGYTGMLQFCLIFYSIVSILTRSPACLHVFYHDPVIVLVLKVHEPVDVCSPSHVQMMI
jgi:hypothetical protein